MRRNDLTHMYLVLGNVRTLLSNVLHSLPDRSGEESLDEYLNRCRVQGALGAVDNCYAIILDEIERSNDDRFTVYHSHGAVKTKITATEMAKAHGFSGYYEFAITQNGQLVIMSEYDHAMVSAAFSDYQDYEVEYVER